MRWQRVLITGYQSNINRGHGTELSNNQQVRDDSEAVGQNRPAFQGKI